MFVNGVYCQKKVKEIDEKDFCSLIYLIREVKENYFIFNIVGSLLNFCNNFQNKQCDLIEFLIKYECVLVLYVYVVILRF